MEPAVTPVRSATTNAASHRTASHRQRRGNSALHVEFVRGARYRVDEAKRCPIDRDLQETLYFADFTPSAFNAFFRSGKEKDTEFEETDDGVTFTAPPVKLSLIHI